MGIKKLRQMLLSFSVTRKMLELRWRFLDWKAIVYPYYKLKREHPDIAFLVYTPDYSNVGDHVIAKAETELLDSMGITYIEVTSGQIAAIESFHWLKVFNGNTILITGGGFLGTLWFSAEVTVRKIIEGNPKSNILLFPNTIYYENTEFGRQELENSVKIYNSHKCLKVLAREMASYEFAKDIYKDVELVPDVALNLDIGCNQLTTRRYCVFCLRNDKEKTLSDEDEHKIIEVSYRYSSDMIFTDMLAETSIPIEKRETYIKEKIELFQSARVVITDRLHAMILCAISATPCIVINSKSPKVQSTYNWIAYLPYIKFAKSLEDIEKLIPELSQMEDCQYDITPLQPYYDRLKEIILEITNKTKNA